MINMCALITFFRFIYFIVWLVSCIIGFKIQYLFQNQLGKKNSLFENIINLTTKSSIPTKTMYL